MKFLHKMKQTVNDLQEKTKEEWINTVATASKDLQAERLAICKSCEHLTKFNRCRQCGCFMDAKTWLAEQRCPIGKWEKISVVNLEEK